MGAGGIINALNGEAAEQRPGAEAAHRLVSSPGPSTDRQPARLTVFFVEFRYSLPYLHKLEEKERGDGAIAGWMTPPKTAAQYLVEQLIAWGCRTVYGVAGDDNLFLLDALEKQRAIRYIACRLETTAALMASAEAKLTGRPAVCTATAGPGAALLAAGLGDAAMDRAPVLAITGQVERKKIGTGAKQAVDQQLLVQPFARYTALTADAGGLPTQLNRAMRTAVEEGRGCPPVGSEGCVDATGRFPALSSAAEAKTSAPLGRSHGEGDPGDGASTAADHPSGTRGGGGPGCASHLCGPAVSSDHDNDAGATGGSR